MRKLVNIINAVDRISIRNGCATPDQTVTAIEAWQTLMNDAQEDPWALILFGVNQSLDVELDIPHYGDPSSPAFHRRSWTDNVQSAQAHIYAWLEENHPDLDIKNRDGLSRWLECTAFTVMVFKEHLRRELMGFVMEGDQILDIFSKNYTALEEFTHAESSDWMNSFFEKKVKIPPMA